VQPDQSRVAGRWRTREDEQIEIETISGTTVGTLTQGWTRVNEVSFSSSLLR
jgi:hypothetical protein